MLRIVDGMGKKGPEASEAELGRAGLSKEKVKRVIGFADISGKPNEVLPSLENKLPKNEMISLGLRELTGTIETVDSLGKTSKVQIDLGIVRGISYYDGTVFEAYDQAGEDVGAVFGGGRFDKLCRIYGKRDMPATGVAGGFERLMIPLRRKDSSQIWNRIHKSMSQWQAKKCATRPSRYCERCERVDSARTEISK